MHKSSELSDVELYSSWRNGVKFAKILAYVTAYIFYIQFLSGGAWRSTSNFLA